jgi:hypothetical protein
MVQCGPLDVLCGACAMHRVECDLSCLTHFCFPLAAWSWSHDEAAWEGSIVTEAAVRADHDAATHWYEDEKNAGRHIPSFDLTASVPGAGAPEHKDQDSGKRYCIVLGIHCHYASDQQSVPNRIPHSKMCIFYPLASMIITFRFNAF